MTRRSSVFVRPELLLCLLLCILVRPVQGALPLYLWPDVARITSVWPVMPPLPPPEGLRTCCAFGYNLQVQLPGVQIILPGYRIDNIVGAGTTGGHRYNARLFIMNLNGHPAERNGIVYTRHGGFVDTAHVRDTADMTVWIFTHLWPRLGKAFTLEPGREELARRRLVFHAFTPPSTARARYALAAGMAARLAWQLAVWHEIAQGYGFESVPGFPEEVSAFSPEDLWSNMLGARIAESLILTGHVASREMYEMSMGQALSQILSHLGAVTSAGTRARLQQLDGEWWDSRRGVPDSGLVIRRNHNTSDSPCPMPVPGEQAEPVCLSLPLSAGRMPASLQLWPGKNMKRLPAPKTFYTADDFLRLAIRIPLPEFRNKE